MKPAVIYAAKSTEDKHGSIPDQLTDGRKLAADRGFEVVAEFQDEAASAFHGDRGPGLASALAECERLSAEHGSCALIVQHSDRLARGDAKHARSLSQVVAWAIGNDVDLLSAHDPEILAGGDLREVMGAIGGFRNHQDSKRKGIAVKSGIRRRAVDRRQYVGGRRPFGYRHDFTLLEDGRKISRLVIDKAEAAIVRRIFAEYNAGFAQNAIARDLEREGVPTLTPAGSWYATTIAGMLKNPLYVGMITHGGEHYPADHEPIIDREAWDKASELREARSAQGRPRGRRTAGRHLLTEGLLVCTCGAAMSPITKRDKRAANGLYETYVCVNRLHHGPSACAQKPIRRAAIDTDDLLIKHVEQSLGEADGLCQQAEMELVKAEAALERIEGDYVAGRITSEQWSRLEDRLSGEADAARAQVQQHGHRREAVEAVVGEFDVQVVIANELAAIRQQIVGEVLDGKEGDLERFRSTLRRLFVNFELVANDDGSYLLLPGPRVSREGERWDFEGAGRGPLDISDNLCSLFAAW
jgi:DNA invertase Pin-like site-specific DNA recombinase